VLVDIVKETLLKNPILFFLKQKNNMPALNLYKLLGLKEVRLRKNYYRNEDDVVLRLTN
jgi:ribosomal-protein-alanine N-acetyltransferase